MSEEDRRYSDSEFALILRKAFELEEHRTGGGSGEGLTLQEIQAVAAEMGLDPASVERAAVLHPVAGEGALVRLFGGPSLYQMQYTAAGEISRDSLTRVVDAIRRVTGHQGKVTEVLGSLEWETVGELSLIHVTVSPLEGQTVVRVLANRGPAGGLTYFLPGVVGLLGIGIIGAITEPTTAVGITSLVAGCLGGAFLTARTIFKTTTKRFRSKLRDLMDATSRAIDETLETEGGSGQ
ncbi:MAG: hypothetical protein JSW46_14085 [Gemmatimonadota bacterium]|nr:MAG: hypothetical protein JSW46_14085 [Gemmatimonadota bacterium]